MTRTLRNFVQFSKYQLASSDATFYILLACLILVNKSLIFSFCLRETCLSHAATNISILAFSDSSNLLFHSFYARFTRGRCNKSKLAYSFFFFFPQELFFKQSIVRIISISAGKKDKTFSIFFFKIKTDPKVCSKIGCYLPNIDRRLLQFTNDFL